MYDQDEEAARRRRLDELFAAEPYLSPTMRARSLDVTHSNGAGPVVSTNGAARPGSASISDLRTAYRSMAFGTAPASASGISAAQLQRLRDDVLTQWIMEMRRAGWSG